MLQKHALGIFCGLWLAGCGSGGSTGVSTVPGSLPATVAPPAVAPRLDGHWKGTLPNGERLEFDLAQEDPQSAEGRGLLFRGDDPQALEVEGTFAEDGQGLLQLVFLDQGRAGEVTELTMAVTSNGSAQAQLQDGSAAFPLTRDETLGKLWDNNLPGPGPEVYRVDARNDLGEEFHLRVTNAGRGRGAWESLGGVPLWSGPSGTLVSSLFDEGKWVAFYLPDKDFTGTYGQLLFPRHTEGQAGSTRPLSSTDSLLNSKESFGWVTGTVTLEVP